MHKCEQYHQKRVKTKTMRRRSAGSNADTANSSSAPLHLWQAITSAVLTW